MKIFAFALALTTGFQSWTNGATNPSGQAAKWKIKNDDSYGITTLGDVNDGRFNLAWDPKTSHKNVSIQVEFRAVSGKIDQGGGVVWRLQEEKNYYISRYNPLENNFRVYFVRNGNRKVLGSTRLKLNPDQWHTLAVKHKGDHIECFLNSKKLLDVNDKTFTNAGKVGLWTKADAVTLFRKFKAVELD